MINKRLSLQNSLKIFYIAILALFIEFGLFVFFAVAGTGLPASRALDILDIIITFFFASMGSLSILAITAPICAILGRIIKINYIGIVALVSITVFTFLTICVNMQKISDWMDSAGIDIFDIMGAVLALGLFFVVEFIVIKIIQKCSTFSRG